MSEPVSEITNVQVAKIFANHIQESANKSYSDLERDINIEQSISNDYRGRAIFEFFQNAIDRADKKIWIHLDKEARTLTIANDGSPFSIGAKCPENKTDFHALLTTHNSSKLAGESIGNKGVGFKSCWEYTKHVSIASRTEGIPWGFDLRRDLTAKTSVGFLKSNEDRINSWLNSDGVENALEGKNLPSFYFPKPLKTEEAIASLHQFKGAQTVITFFKLNDAALNDLQTKIEDFSKHQIFMVRQLDALSYKEVQLSLWTGEGAPKLLNTYENKNEWQLVSKDFSDVEKDDLHRLSADLNYPVKNPKVAIAFPLSEDAPIDSKFYCHLPTELDCGFNVLIHSDFLLDVSRKQIDFKSNPYNKKLLEHAADLLVESLYEINELHVLPHFSKFLSPGKSNNEFKEMVKHRLFHSRTRMMTQVLKKVYTSERHVDSSYSYLFQSMREWTRGRLSGEKRKCYLDRVYLETISFFCDEDIYSIPVGGLDTVSLPKRNDSPHQLFFRDLDNENKLLDTHLLKEVTSISLSGFQALSDFTQLWDLNLVLKFDSLRLVRALTKECKEISTQENILQFCVQLVYANNLSNEYYVNVDYFLNGDAKYNSIKNYLSEIKLPCIDGIWYAARECYFGLPSELKSLMDDKVFHQLDLELCIELFNSALDSVDNTNLNIENILRYFGVWDVLPLKYTSPTQPFLPWASFDDFPTNDTLKQAIIEALPTWSHIHSLDKVIAQLQNQRWYWDEVNKQLNCPIDVFLFNDNYKRGCIAQGRKSEYRELHDVLEIQTIEDTHNPTKLVRQLKVMELQSHVTESHKTLYKQLFYRYSKINNEVNEELPLLVNSGNDYRYLSRTSQVDMSNIWFVPTDQKKYKHLLGKAYNFLLADDDISEAFVVKQGCRLFKPSYEIHYSPKNNEFEDLESKQKIELTLLPTLLALAESVLGGRLDKALVLQRWSGLKILKADNVYIEIKLNSIVEKLYTEEDVDVLYKPLSKDQRSSSGSHANLYNVGEIAHDLKNPMSNPNLSKFGPVLADALFRKVELSSIFEIYLNHYFYDKDSLRITHFLNDHGVNEKDINDNKNFIKQCLLTEDESDQLLKDLITITGIENLSKENWTDRKSYKESKCDFTGLKQAMQSNDKVYGIIDSLDPSHANLRKIREAQEDIMLRAYCSELKIDFEDRLKLLPLGLLQNFNLKVSDSYQHFGITYEYTEYDLELAKLEMANEYIHLDTSNKPICGGEAKVSTSCLQSKSKTYLVNTSQEEREQDQKKQHKRGMTAEKTLALTWAKNLLAHDLKDDFLKKAKISLTYLEPDHAHTLQSFYTKLQAASSLKEIADLLQVSVPLGDGLGYDVLEPVIENGKLIGMNKVEVKSSKGNTQIHFSRNELEKVLAFQDSEDWKLYHFVGRQLYNRTDPIRNAVKKFAANTLETTLALQAESWVIDFE